MTRSGTIAIATQVVGSIIKHQEEVTQYVVAHRGIPVDQRRHDATLPRVPEAEETDAVGRRIARADGLFGFPQGAVPERPFRATPLA